MCTFSSFYNHSLAYMTVCCDMVAKAEWKLESKRGASWDVGACRVGITSEILFHLKLHFDGWPSFSCMNCLSLNLYCLQLHWYIGSIQFGCWAESKCKNYWHMIMCKKIMQELTTNKRMILRWLCCAYISAAFSFRIIFHGLPISQSRSCCWNLSLLFTLVHLHPTKQIAL